MYTALALVVLAGLLGPLLASGRRFRVPVLVGELIAGIILGRTGLNLVDPTTQPFPVFASLGFAMLMLDAGTEVDIGSRLLRDGLVRAGLAFVVTLVASIPIALGIAGLLGSNHVPLFVILLVGSSAAVAFPAIQEGRLSGPSVALVIAWITLADAVTVLVMPLTLTGAGRIPAALLGDALIVAVAAATIALGRRLFATAWAQDAKLLSIQRRWALRLRISVLLLLCLGAIAEQTGASLLVAGFAAGIVLRQFHEPPRLTLELTGLAAGFFVPAFFVLLGASLDLKGLVRSPSAIGLAVALALAATAVHLLAARIACERHWLPSGLLASAQLGLPAAAAALGLSTGAVSPPVATALVAAGLLTLIPSTTGALLLGRAATDGSTAPT